MRQSAARPRCADLGCGKNAYLSQQPLASDGIVKLSENACGAVDVSGLGGGT